MLHRFMSLGPFVEVFREASQPNQGFTPPLPHSPLVCLFVCFMLFYFLFSFIFILIFPLLSFSFFFPFLFFFLSPSLPHPQEKKKKMFREVTAMSLRFMFILSTTSVHIKPQKYSSKHLKYPSVKQWKYYVYMIHLEPILWSYNRSILVY